MPMPFDGLESICRNTESVDFMIIIRLEDCSRPLCRGLNRAGLQFENIFFPASLSPLSRYLLSHRVLPSCSLSFLKPLGCIIEVWLSPSHPDLTLQKIRDILEPMRPPICRSRSRHLMLGILHRMLKSKNLHPTNVHSTSAPQAVYALAKERQSGT